LSTEEQEFLAVASVAGVEFATATVAAVMQRPLEEVEGCYDRLAQQGQFVRVHGVETYPDGAVSTCYRFLHALYHEMVYARIAPGRRARWHHQIGTWKSTTYGSQTAQVAAELARHFEQGQDSSQAIVYYQQASESAIRRSAHREAVGHTRRALALLEGQPQTPARASQEIDLLVMLAASLQALQGYGAPELGALYRRALALSPQGVAPAQLFGAFLGISSFYIFQTQYSAAQELAAQCLRIAPSLPGDIPVIQAHVILGRCALARGAFAVALEHLEQGIALYRPQYHRQARVFLLHDPGVMGLLFSAWALWRLGYPERAGQRSATARALAQELGHPFSLACALGLGTWLHQYRGDVLATQAQSMETIRLATEHGFPFWVAQGTFLYGWSLAAQGQTAQGLQQMYQGVQLYQAIIGVEGGQTAFLPPFVEILCQTQESAEAMRLLDAGMRRIAANGEEDYRAELLRLRGEVLLACSATQQAEAEQCFFDSLAVARRQQAKLWELRTALSLGRLWLRQNKADEARTLVAEVYGWFSEGFDLAELRQAWEMLAG
jgi:predicted ATPase